MRPYIAGLEWTTRGTHKLFVNGSLVETVSDSTYPTGGTTALVVPHKAPPAPVSRWWEYDDGDYCAPAIPPSGDSGSVSPATPGILRYTPASPVSAAGRVLGLIHADVGITVRAAAGSSLISCYGTSLGANSLNQFFTKTMACGALDATAWDSATAAASLEYCGLWLRITQP